MAFKLFKKSRSKKVIREETPGTSPSSASSRQKVRLVPRKQSQNFRRRFGVDSYDVLYQVFCREGETNLSFVFFEQ